MWGTAVIISLLCISVYIVWIPARLQISPKWVRFNTYWDRAEKVVYLFVDAALNVYFIRVVRENLVRNGLYKYDRLVQFNQRIIVVSMLMDIMIIAAMDIPNGFVYAIFHPLAYLIKLNIELSMAHLIRRIALENRARPLPHNGAIFDGVQSTQSSAIVASISPRRTFLHSLLGRQNDQVHQPEDVISKRQDFVVQSSVAINPEEVQMDRIWDESPFGSSRISHEAHDTGLRSMAEARVLCQDEGLASSAKSKEAEDEWTTANVAKPEPTWPSVKWSEVQLNGPG
ncbi:hypothetical protein NX059_005845 [Plenodomus lindquistii]|nr:hypothetical protein NX059_005845 [Plenodomus lindquistii]